MKSTSAYQLPKLYLSAGVSVLIALPYELRRRCRRHELREFDIYQAHRYILFCRYKRAVVDDESIRIIQDSLLFFRDDLPVFAF